MIIELNEKQHANLVVFMQRVQLSGAEVPAYAEIVDRLNRAILLTKKPQTADQKIPEKKPEGKQ